MKKHYTLIESSVIDERIKECNPPYSSQRDAIEKEAVKLMMNRLKSQSKQVEEVDIDETKQFIANNTFIDGLDIDVLFEVFEENGLQIIKTIK